MYNYVYIHTDGFFGRMVTRNNSKCGPSAAQNTCLPPPPLVVFLILGSRNSHQS